MATVKLLSGLNYIFRILSQGDVYDMTIWAYIDQAAMDPHGIDLCNSNACKGLLHTAANIFAFAA